MPDMRIEHVPEDLLRELKVAAATHSTTVRALVIAAIERVTGHQGKTGFTASRAFDAARDYVNSVTLEAKARKAGKA